MKQLPDGQYNFKETEEKILKFWQSKPFFKPEFDPKTGEVQTLEEFKKDSREKWTLICPPPNANGNLHIGHMSGYTYQDIMARYKRIRGKRVLLLPGKDHAGIQTEVVFEKELEKKGINKLTLGREEFYKQCYEFCMNASESARSQEKRIGLSADFERELFTLDPRIVSTVLGTFINLHKDNMVYKGARIVNWCVRCQTTLADIDTERKERETNLVYIAYKIAGSKDYDLRNFFVKPELSSDEIIDNGYSHELFFINTNINDLFPVNSNNGKAYKNFIKIFEKEDLLDSSKSKDVFCLPGNEEFDFITYLKIFTHYKFHQSFQKVKISFFNKVIEEKMKVFENYLFTATTRPETMLGDTALVVNPKDERYKNFVGKKVLIPLANREIPIITNPRIEQVFGTGVLKLTPAHAPEDSQIATEYEAETGTKIPYINIIWKDGKLTGPIPSEFIGLKVNAAHSLAIEKLQEQNLIVKTEKLTQNVTVCERCKSIIEPLMSSQWFIKIDEIRDPAIEAVKKGEVKIYPEEREKMFFQWMENLRDWPVSRQLWWGYRIPVWYNGEIKEFVNTEGQIELKINLADQIKENWIDLDSENLNHVRVQIENPGEGWIQDPDVFDTWFSSGQWPYATLMAREGDFEKYYQTQMLETGYDILFFWVSRMIMLGLYRTGKVPFKEVYLHGLITDKNGDKMSKSKGNGVEPDELIEKYGTDALRFSYAMGSSPGTNIAVYDEKVKGLRNFVNKIWNASKFVMMNLEGIEENPLFEKVKNINNATDFDEFYSYNLYEIQNKQNEVEFENPNSLDANDPLDNRDMLDHLMELEVNFKVNFENYKFGRISEDLYASFWHKFCDEYIENVKDILWKDKETGKYKIEASPESRFAAQAILYYSLKSYLKMLHPFIPFVTEEIWQHLVEDGEYKMPLMYRE